MTIEIFKFGDPEPIHEDTSFLMESFLESSQEYYVPPLDLKGLAKIGRANATHQRCIVFKVNQMSIVYNQGLLSLRDHRRACQDLITFGNAYLQVIKNAFGVIIKLLHIPAVNMRKRKKKNHFLMLKNDGSNVKFKENEVLHLMHYDTYQTRYGVPDWLGAHQDVFLNSEATLFRRRYYINGSHMGYILYTNDANINVEDEKALKEQIRNGKGAGNFRSMHINIPNGGEKAVQLIPIGDISQKDEFQRIKEISANDIVIAHGVQPALAGIKPENTGGFGDIGKIEKYYRQNEVRGLVQPFNELNDVLIDMGVAKNNLFGFDFNLNLLDQE